MEYFRRYGSWRINVTASNNNVPVQSNSTIRNASYQSFALLQYPYPRGDNIDLGTITALDVFSLGKGANTTKNTGNIRLNLTWNATRFDCGGSAPYINITDQSVPPYSPANFAVANTSTMTPSNYAFINGTSSIETQFFPGGGMRRCGNYLCSQDENLLGPTGGYANYTTYWHINVTGGTLVCSPYYTNKISVNQIPYINEG
jgi:hypothetical protein